jgi:hypothetical protein
METERCKRLVTAIQQLEHTEIEELFKLLHSNKCDYTRNNNGVFVNMSWLSEDMLNKLETYVAFCNKSQNEVKRYESLCDILNKNIHEQRSQERQPEGDASALAFADPKQDKKVVTNRVSSSMKFYLLKKRFAKQVMLTANVKSDLKNEEYLM